jgi:hypothetical protein
VSFLPELTEREAAGEKARIYEEMRHLGGVPMVALIFRHLATLPGGIEWVWNAIGPAWRAGLVQEAAWRIAGEAKLPALAPIPPEALPALGVDAAALGEIRVVLRAYNRANPENLLSVLCLLHLADGSRSPGRTPGDGGGLTPAGWVPPAAPGPLVPMMDVAKAPPEVAALFDLIATPGDAGGPRLVQSLYRHFGHRPAFLSLVVTLLHPLLRDGAIASAATALRARMDAEAKQLAGRLSAPPAPDPGIRTALARFGGNVIPQMIVVGALLERSVPDAPREAPTGAR